MTEECGICEEVVPFSSTVHLLIHTQSEDGVVDRYVCKQCYASDVAPLFE